MIGRTPALRTSLGRTILHYAAPVEAIFEPPAPLRRRNWDRGRARKRWIEYDEVPEKDEDEPKEDPAFWPLVAAGPRKPRAPKEPKPPKSDSPWMDKHGFSQDVLNSNALAWWDRMTPQQQHEAQFWYPAFHDWAGEMAARKGIHPHKGPGVVAATSPLRRWDGNIQDAHNLLTNYPEHPENIKKPPGLSAGANVDRAKRVYDAPDDPESIRSALSSSADPDAAKKILNFHDLGVNPEHGGAFNYAQHPVVIDSWMPRGILTHPDQAEAVHSEDISLVPPSLRDRKVKKVRKKNPQTGVWEDQGHRDPNLRDVGLWALNAKGGYERMGNALRHVAQQRGLPFTHIAQAGIWNRLGGTGNPEVAGGDGVADHDNGPLTHITDPQALYDEVWGRQLRTHPMQTPAVPKAATVSDPEHNHVDNDWDHLHTPLPHTPAEETPPPDPNNPADQAQIVREAHEDLELLQKLLRERQENARGEDNGGDVTKGWGAADFMHGLGEAIRGQMPPGEGWFHASQHDLPVGTKLVPSGSVGNPNRPASESFYNEGWGEDRGQLDESGDGRAHHVWLTPHKDDAHFWSAVNNAPHIYEVEPDEEPWPWNGTGTDGYVVPGATIKRKIHGPEIWEPGEAGQHTAGRPYTPEEMEHYRSRGWRGDGPCENPDHHGNVAGRCPQCGRQVAPEEHPLAVAAAVLSAVEAVL